MSIGFHDPINIKKRRRSLKFVFERYGLFPSSKREEPLCQQKIRLILEKSKKIKTGVFPVFQTLIHSQCILRMFIEIQIHKLTCYLRSRILSFQNLFCSFKIQNFFFIISLCCSNSYSGQNLSLIHFLIIAIISIIYSHRIFLIFVIDGKVVQY